jgi:hypothetical protein
MKPTTILLNQAIEQSLRELADQQGKTVNDIVQEAIQLYLQSNSKHPPQSIGMGQSNIGNLSERVDDLLWQE